MEYTLVTWPESQALMEQDWFDECLLINDAKHLDQLGSAAYLVPKQRYTALTKEGSALQDQQPDCSPKPTMYGNAERTSA